MQVVDVLFDGVSWSWRGVVLAGVSFAVGSGLANAVAPAVSASARERATVSGVVSAGALPSGAGREWVDRLAAEDRRLRSARTGVPGLAAFLVLAVAVIAVQAQDPMVWLCVAGLVLAGALGASTTDRRLRTVERLAAELGSRTRV
jgi:fructose-1,6-bisphosphatase/inositol monophosphatase family enzyme